MFKTILQSVSVSLLSVLVGFILSIVLARLLGPEARGIYGSILTFAILIAGFSQLGLAQGYVYNSRRYQLNGLQLILKSCFWVILLASFCLVITDQFFLLTDVAPYFFVLIVLSLSSALHSYFQNAAQIDQRLYFYNALKLFVPSANLAAITVYYIVANELTIIASVNIMIVTTLLSALILAYCVLNIEFTRAEKKPLALSKILAYSSKIYGTSVIGIGINSIDKVVLLGLGSMKEFGLYSVAFGLSRLVGIIPETLSTVVYSRFAGKDEALLSKMVRLMFSGLFIPLISCCILLAIISSWLVALLFGEDYIQAALPFVLLTFEAVISSLGWLLAQRFNASGRPGLVFLRQAVSIIPLLIVPFYQFELSLLVAVSLALLMSSILRLLMTLVLYDKVLNERFPAFYPSSSECKNIKVMIQSFFGSR